MNTEIQNLECTNIIKILSRNTKFIVLFFYRDLNLQIIITMNEYKDYFSYFIFCFLIKNLKFASKILLSFLTSEILNFT